MATKRKIDWPQVAVLAVVAVCAAYLVIHLDPEKAEAWIALVPTLAVAVSVARGRILGDPAPAPAPRPRRERETDAPPPGES